MRRFTLTFSVLFVLALLLVACQPLVAPVEVAPAEEVSAVAIPATALDPALVAEIEMLVEQAMEQGQIPGAAIGIVADGELAYANGFGVADLNSDTPVTPQTLFQIASVSKTAVAVAILQLVEQGLVDLDAPVTEYLPYFTLVEPESRNMTIRQLLTHTAGMPDVASWIAEVRDQELRTDEMALEDYIRSLSDESLLFPPGESYMYSSIGYDVLGDVISKTSGHSFEEYMLENILIPLGMDNSSFRLSEVNPDLLAEPYTYDEDGGVEATGYYPYVRRHGPSTALWTNVEDLARYATALLQHGKLDGTQVFPASAVDEMWTPYIETGWAEWFGPTWESYGLGWLIGEVDGHLVPNHTGGMDDGYQAHLLLIPDEDIAIVALVNVFGRNEGSFRAYGIADEMMKVLLGIEPEETATEQSTTPVTGFAEVNGTRLYYEMAGEGEPMMLIHGLGWDTSAWDQQFAELAKHYKVVNYAMRGFGKSDMPTDQPYAHADDLKALMDYLEIEKAHMIGHSFGGEIALNFAVAYPEATQSLVLIEPDIQGAEGLPALTPEEEASFTAAFEALEKGDHAGAAQAIVDIHPLCAVSKDVPSVRESILAAFTDYQWFQFLNEDPVVQPEPPTAKHIGEIAVPTLLFVGDTTTPYQAIEVDMLAEQLPNARTVVVKNSDHFPHMLYPDDFNVLVVEFLTDL